MHGFSYFVVSFSFAESGHILKSNSRDQVGYSSACLMETKKPFTGLTLECLYVSVLRDKEATTFL